MTDNQRINFGPRLKKIREAKNMTQKTFYQPVTNYANNFSAIENGKRPVGGRNADQLIAHYEINEEFLRTGMGEMFTANRLQLKNYADYSSEADGVPFYNINPTEISGREFNLLREKPEYYVNFRPFNDCDAYLPIYGDSMYPKYASGEIIAVREVINKEIIQWGEAYLIMADEQANNITTVKLLFEHQSTNKIVLRASNPNYKGDTILDKKAIKKLFLVKGKITRNQL